MMYSIYQLAAHLTACLLFLIASYSMCFLLLLASCMDVFITPISTAMQDDELPLIGDFKNLACFQLSLDFCGGEREFKHFTG